MPSVPVHYCELPEDHGGLTKLPPHASRGAKILRCMRKFLAPNPNSAICKRTYRNKSQVNAERRRHAHNKCIFIIHPYSDLEFYREILYIIVGVWEILTSPLTASFGYVWRKSKTSIFEESFLNYSNLLFIVLEILWIVSCFFSGYKEKNSKVIVLNHWKIVKRYLLTYFIIDVMIMTPPFDMNYFEDWVYFLNLAIFARYNTLLTFKKRILADFRVPDNVITFVILMITSFYLIHVLTCTFYVLPLLHYINYEKLWLVKTLLHPNKPLIKVYFACASLIQINFFGLGESKLRIENLMEITVLIAAMIIGRLWSLYFLATMLRLFTISSLSESKYEEYLLQLKTFISQKQIPKELGDRLLEYYHFKYQHHYFNEKAIFNAMSFYLKQEILLFEARNVINKVKIFKFFPRSLVGSIIAKCKVMVFLNNDSVINVGDPLDTVYFLSCGTLAVLNSRGVEITHVSDGQEIGIRGVVNPTSTIFKFSYVAIETTELYAISLKDFKAIVCNKDDILKYFSKRVEQTALELEKIEILASAQGTDLLSELHHGKVLERPRIRTRYFEH